ncbi:MAG: flagellar hook-basal body complex protein [Cyanobacteriota bacterium]
MIQDIMRRVTMNASTQFKNLGYISTNVSNYSTNAYKCKHFNTYLDEAGQLKATVRGDTSKGAILMSKNPLDVAIDGPGYFYVTKPDGTTAYTRDGRFIINSQGYLSTISGALVGNGIRVPVNYYKLYFESDGTVKIRIKEEDDPKEIGKINIVNFPNPGALKEIGGNLQAPTEASGDAEPVENPNYVKQYANEMSNLSVWDTISEVLRTNGSYIASLRIVKYADEMYRQSVNLKQ